MSQLRISDSAEEAEDSDFIVCARYSGNLILPDNKIGVCVKCGHKIQYRPHVPKNPQLACLDCMLPLMEKEAERDDLDIIATSKTMEEIMDFFKKKMAN